MLTGEVPDIPGLYFAADVTDASVTPVSATGISTTSDGAKLHCWAELAERIALAHWRDGRAAGADIQGSAARPSREHATFHAVLELRERLVCLAWWQGAHAAALPCAADAETFAELRVSWPRRRERRTGLIDLTPSPGQYVFGAWSCNDTGLGFCIGTAAGNTARQAIQSALFELYQMEFGLDIIRHRRRHGVQLMPAEIRQVNRAEGLDIAELEGLLSPSGQCRTEAAFAINPVLHSLPSPDPGLHVVLTLPDRTPAPARAQANGPAWALY